MARRTHDRPTDLELEILKVLWDEGPSTVRAVQDVMSRERPVGYTTVLKMLQIMTEKGLVVPDKNERAHVYRSKRSRGAVLRSVAGDVLDRAFDGSAQQLMLHALEHAKATPEELSEIRGLLDEMERSRK
jgi:predicted transcriptional regulator